MRFVLLVGRGDAGFAIGDFGRAAITVIDRGGTVLAPKRTILLEDADSVYVLYKQEDAQLIELMFGPATEETGD